MSTESTPTNEPNTSGDPSALPAVPCSQPINEVTLFGVNYDGAFDEEEGVQCDRCCGDGMIEYLDGDGTDWGEDCPSEVNHLITCRQCGGTGYL